MSKQQKTAHGAHSKASRLTFTATGRASEYRTKYTYDPAGNRLSEQAGGMSNSASFNALNQLSTCTCASGASRTNEWDAQDRLTAVNQGDQRTEFTFDGLSRLASIRQLTNGTQSSLRRFVWCEDDICLELDGSGAVTKQFFRQGVRLEIGTNAGNYYYTRDHLGSVREVTDANGTLRARFAYDPYGRRTKTGGDLDADFGFAGLFRASEAGLNIARFRAYDPELGRWLSRDPLKNAELAQGPNLYLYVANDPINKTDRLGLNDCCEPWHQLKVNACESLREVFRAHCSKSLQSATYPEYSACRSVYLALLECKTGPYMLYHDLYTACLKIPCGCGSPPSPTPSPPPPSPIPSPPPPENHEDWRDYQ